MNSSREKDKKDISRLVILSFKILDVSFISQHRRNKTLNDYDIFLPLFFLFIWLAAAVVYILLPA